MGYLRLGCSFIVSLFVIAVLTIIGGIFGSLVSVLLIGHGAPFSNITGPQDFVQQNSLGAGTLIGGGIGAVLGILAMVSIMRRAADINWLKRYGTRIMATVTEIKQERRSRQVSSFSGNQGQTRTEWYTVYIIVARWTDPKTNISQSFTSSDLTFRPQKFPPGSGIEVLIDPDNLKRYYMET